jgi:signal peptidase I
MRARILPAVLLPVSILAVLAVLFNSFFALHCVREHSMEPVLPEGQTILVLKRFWDKKGYMPGDILVFKSPADGKMVVKRCVLVSDDPLDIRYGWLHTTRGRYYLSPDQKNVLTGFDSVPDQSFFAIGDNHGHSIDSRTWGFVHIGSVEGRVIFPVRRSGSR